MSLKHAVKQHFEQQQLSDQALLKLRQLQQQPSGSEFHRRQAGLILATVTALFIGLALVLWPGAITSETMANQIAAEVARNHIKMKPLEVKGQQLAPLQRYFTELDFRLTDSSHLQQPKVLTGGRYCSIKGITAAQLRYQHRQRQLTLYQVPYDKALFGPLPVLEQGQAAQVVLIRGLRVEIWVEKGLLMVSAEDAR